MRVLVVGDVSVAVAARIDRVPLAGSNTILRDPDIYVSGVGANLACNLHHLGLEVEVVAGVGGDAYAATILDDLARRGVDLRRIQRSASPTSVFMLLTDGAGERTMIGYRGANEDVALRPTDLTGAGVDWLHLSGYVLLNNPVRHLFRDLVDAASRLGISCSVDLEGLAQAGHTLDLGGVTALCNRDEYRAYFAGRPIEPRPEVERLVVKAGGEGSYLIEGANLVHVPAVACDLLDATGAGDAFNAGLIAGRLSGLSWLEACAWGNAAASCNVAAPGPHPPLHLNRIVALAGTPPAVPRFTPPAIIDRPS